MGLNCVIAIALIVTTQIVSIHSQEETTTTTTDTTTTPTDTTTTSTETTTTTTTPTETTTMTTTTPTETTITPTTSAPITLPPVTIPAINGVPCTLTINALVALPVVVADGLCYDDKIIDRVCCKNLVVLGGGGVGLVSITQTCQPTQYCCIAKADIQHITGNVTVLC